MLICWKATFWWSNMEIKHKELWNLSYLPGWCWTTEEYLDCTMPLTIQVGQLGLLGEWWWGGVFTRLSCNPCQENPKTAEDDDDDADACCYQCYCYNYCYFHCCYFCWVVCNYVLFVCIILCYSLLLRLSIILFYSYVFIVMASLTIGIFCSEYW